MCLQDAYCSLFSMFQPKLSGSYYRLIRLKRLHILVCIVYKIKHCVTESLKSCT